MELRKKLYQKFQEPKQSEVLLKGIWNLGRQRNRALICVRNISSQVQISPDLSLSQLQRRIHQFIVISNLVILTARRDSLTIFSGRRGWVLGVCQRLKERWTLQFTTLYYVLFLAISVWILITKQYLPVAETNFWLGVVGSPWRLQLGPSILNKAYHWIYGEGGGPEGLITASLYLCSTCTQSPWCPAITMILGIWFQEMKTEGKWTVSATEDGSH